MEHDPKTQQSCDREKPADAAHFQRLAPTSGERGSAESWLAENAEALSSSNSFVEMWSLPLAKHRQF
jgi:post-segregation antitoxin CcdA